MGVCTAIHFIKDHINKKFPHLKDTIHTIIQGIKDKIKAKIPAIKAKIQKLWDLIKGHFDFIHALDFDFEGHLLHLLNLIPGVEIVELIHDMPEALPEEMPTVDNVASMLTAAIPIAEVATI